MTTDRWLQVDRLYHAALERSLEARPAFLDVACGGDAALRGEVESLLRYQPAAAGFLERPALQDAAERLAGEIESASDPVVAGYTILRTLGEGGMGVVYLAEQMAPMRRRVALKLIKPGMDTRQVVARFEGERQALALMHHPHIAAVFDAGATADGRPYFVMEYVDGVPITTFCDRHRLSTRARLELFTEVCAAVQHAHQKGVIHRDLKPANVLVSEPDGRPLPKIIDFGIAKATAPLAAGRLAFTEQGMMVGTPEYMSPEQAAFSADIDTTTDVYSLGVLLYELLVGALPFDPKMLREKGYDEMRRIIRESDPPKPSSRLPSAGVTAEAVASARQTDTGRLTRHLRGDLDWITLKALEKDRRLRYTTVAAFAADIAHFLADEPITARPPSAVYRLRKFTRRYRGAVVAVGAIFVLLVAGLTVSIRQYFRAESQRVEADRQRARADAEREAAVAAAADAERQRNAAIGATTESDRQRMLATRASASADEARQDAEYRAYIANIIAADDEPRTNAPNDARDRLLAVPAGQRAWEWRHLFLKTDTSLATLTSSAPCARPGEDESFPITNSDNVLALRALGARILLRRCSALDQWNAPAFDHSTYRAAGKVLAVGAAGETLVIVPGSSTAKTTWALRLVTSNADQIVSSFGPFPAEPICADISADGTRVALGFMPQFSPIGEPLEDFFEVWNARAARRLLGLAPPKPPLFDTRNRYPTTCMVAFSPDSTRLATSGATVHIWRADTGTEVTSDATQAGFVAQPIAFNTDGSQLAIGRLTGLVDILGMVPGRPARSLDGNGFVRVLPLPDGDRRTLVQSRRKNEVLSIAFSPDGARVITGTNSGIGVWNLALGQLQQVLAGHAAAVIGVAVAPDGRIFSADESGSVKVWLPGSSGAVTVLPGSSSPARAFALSRSGTVVGVAQSDAAVFAWQLGDLRQVVLRAGSGQLDVRHLARSLAVSPDGRQLLAGEYDAVGTVRTWSVVSGDSTATPMNASTEKGCENVQPASPYNAVSALAVSPDGRSLAFAQGRCLIVRDLSTMKIRATLHEYSNSFMFRPDGSLLVAAYHWLAQPTGGPGHAKVLIWDWRSDRILVEIPTPPTATDFENGSWRIAMSADGSRVAVTGGRQTRVAIWDGNLRRELGRLPVPSDTGIVALSPDGHRIASTDSQTTVRIWDADRLQLLLILTDEDRHSGGLAFTPDGRLIAGRSSGGLTIWETQKRPPPGSGR